MRLLAALKMDIKFQIRHGFYHAYALVSLVYIIILKTLPLEAREMAATFLIATDPSVLGFFFIGGILLLEKGQNTLDALLVSPLRPWEYLSAKVLALTFLAVVTCLAITFFTFGKGFSPVPLIIGTTLTSIVFTNLGISLALRVKTLNQFLLSSSLVGLLFLPVAVEYLGLFTTPLFDLFPVGPTLNLIDNSVHAAKLFPAQSIGVLASWAVATSILALNWFQTYVILGKGEER